jgi:hypothetical protein
MNDFRRDTCRTSRAIGGVGRRGFLIGGVSALTLSRPVFAAAPTALATGDVIGQHKMLVVSETSQGRVLAFDSSARDYPMDKATTRDVVIVGSYCGTSIMGRLFSLGVRGFVALDAGIGKDGAGITALQTGDELGVPVAAIAALSAEAANGRSAAMGLISRANKHAAALGIKPGMPAYDAAGRILANAPVGKPTPMKTSVDEKPQIVEETAKGKIWVSTSSFVFKDKKMSNDVVCIGANSGRVLMESLVEFMPRGAISNDAGLGKNNSCVEGVRLAVTLGIAAASVSTMSARIGDGMSTWQDGVISFTNRIADDRGVRVGMTAKEAARRMLG